MCQQQFEAEVMAEAAERQEEEYVAVRLNSTDDLFALMCAMNRARVEEITGVNHE